MNENTTWSSLGAIILAGIIAWIVCPIIFDFFDNINDELNFIYPKEEPIKYIIEIR